MPSLHRLWLTAVLGGLGVLTTAAPARAQIFGGVGNPYAFSTLGWSPIPQTWFGGLPPIMPVSPLPGVNQFNPLMFSPFNRNYNPQLSNAVTYGYLNRLSYPAPAAGPSSYGSLYTPISGYSAYGGVTGGYPSVVRNPAVESLYRDYGKAQKQAAEADSTRKAIANQRAYERNDPAAPGANADTDVDTGGELGKALAGADPAAIASGEALNRILAAVIATGMKPERVDSMYLPPDVLAGVRFAGGPNADALNLLRSAGKLEFPAAFNDGPLAALRQPLERDFAAVAAPILAGKPAEQAKVAALEATAKKASDALAPAIKDLDFEQATAARRFLNQFDSAVKVLKTRTAVELVDPKWVTEGTSVADLARHMNRHKLQFGPVVKGREEAYRVLHRGLSAYLFNVLQAAPQPKK